MKYDPRGPFRKCVHLKIFDDTHEGLREILNERKLSIQETFEELSQLIAIEDSRLISVLDDLIDKKHMNESPLLGNIHKIDANTLLDLIEREEKEESE